MQSRSLLGKKYSGEGEIVVEAWVSGLPSQVSIAFSIIEAVEVPRDPGNSDRGRKRGSDSLAFSS